MRIQSIQNHSNFGFRPDIVTGYYGTTTYCSVVVVVDPTHTCSEVRNGRHGGFEKNINASAKPFERLLPNQGGKLTKR